MLITPDIYAIGSNLSAEQIVDSFFGKGEIVDPNKISWTLLKYKYVGISRDSFVYKLGCYDKFERKEFTAVVYICWSLTDLRWYAQLATLDM